jgi:hypothetical protein
MQTTPSQTVQRACSSMYRGNNALATVLMLKANNIKHTVETRARVTIPTRRPNEERPTPMLQHLEFGWIEVPLGYIALVTLLLPEGCVQAVEIQVRPNLKEKYIATQQRSAMLFEGVYFRTEPAGIPYALLPVPTSPLSG